MAARLGDLVLLGLPPRRHHQHLCECCYGPRQRQLPKPGYSRLAHNLDHVRFLDHARPAQHVRLLGHPMD